MIAGLSKAINQYLAPLLSLTSLLLILFTFLSPVVMLETKVALLTVAPSTSLTQPGTSSTVDGPSIFLGPLGKFFIFLRRCICDAEEISLTGSCERKNNEAAVNCTAPMINPTYGAFDLTVRHSNYI